MVGKTSSVHHSDRRAPGNAHRLHGRAHRRRQGSGRAPGRARPSSSSRPRSPTPPSNIWTCPPISKESLRDPSYLASLRVVRRFRARAAPVRRRYRAARERLGRSAARSRRRRDRADPQRPGGGREAPGAPGQGSQEDQEPGARPRIRAAGALQGRRSKQNQPLRTAGTRRRRREAHSRISVPFAEADALRAESGRRRRRAHARDRGANIATGRWPDARTPR